MELKNVKAATRAVNEIAGEFINDLAASDYRDTIEANVGSVSTALLITLCGVTPIATLVPLLRMLANDLENQEEGIDLFQ